MAEDRTLALLGAAHVHLDDHLRVMAESGWRVAHMHDRDPRRQAAMCERLQAEPLGTLEDLSRVPLRGVIVCSETVHHEADIRVALHAGLPVFTEKPMAGSARAARACAELAEAAGLLLHTGYFMRTNAGLRTIRDWLADGMIGRIIHARMRFSHDGGFADWLNLDSWMSDPALACYDGFTDEAVHCLDTLQWMLGPIVGGAGATGNTLGLTLADQGAAVLRFESGATGVIESGWTDIAMRLEIDLIGKKGQITLQDGKIALIPRGAEQPANTATLSPLDAGAGLCPFLEALEGAAPKAIVPPSEATQINVLLDGMGLRVGAS